MVLPWGLYTGYSSGMESVPPLFTPSLHTGADVLLPEEAAAAGQAPGIVWAGSRANSILFSFIVRPAPVLAHNLKLLSPCLPLTYLVVPQKQKGF